MTDMPPQTIRLCLQPAPFSALRREFDIAAGQTIAAILETHGIRSHAHVLIGDQNIPCHLWPHVRPKAGTTLNVRTIPAGGGGRKNPLRAVLSLALMAAAPQISGALMGALNLPAGATLFGVNASRLFSGALNIAGRLAMGALAPPGGPKFSANRQSPTLFIQGARNDLLPFGRVPRVLGKHRMVPPLGARPFTETVGNDQYIRMLFVWGYGPLRISDLKIGETPITEFDDVEIETRTGSLSDAALTLYGSSVLQNDLQVGLTAAGSYQTRTTEKNADEISVDVTFPSGLVRFDSNGKKQLRRVRLEIQYSPAGQNQWSAGSESFKSIGAQSTTNLVRPEAYIFQETSYSVTRIDRIVLDPASGSVSVITGTSHRTGLDAGSAAIPAIPPGFLKLARVERRSNDPLAIPSSRITDERDSSLVGSVYQAAGNFAVTTSGNDGVAIASGGLKFIAIDISAKQATALRRSVKFKVPKGQYDVRVRRITADSTDQNVFDTSFWTALRTHRNQSPINMAGLALTALRIKATDQLNGVIDRFNGVVESILPDWTGSAWVEQVTNNPASVFRHVLQGAANARPLSDSRINLTALEDWHERCASSGYEFNAVIDYDTSVRQVLSDAAASGRSSPAIVDGKWTVIEDIPKAVPVQHFTPRNTFGFHGEKAFDDLPHALRIRFLNKDKGWQEDERLIYDDGFDAENATKFEGIELPGITGAEQVWKHGRYHIATARLRPETYSFFTDIEHIVCTRGDLIRFTHDVPLFGLMSGRVTSIATSGSNAISVTLDAKVTMEAGKSYSLRFRKSGGDTLIKTLVTATGETQTLTFATPFPAAEAPAPGDLAMFGETGTESVELIVKSIEPQGNLSAKITCVDAAPGVHVADTGAIPAFSSQITVPKEMQRPPVPELAQIQSGEEALTRNPDGSIAARIVITLKPPTDSDPFSIVTLIRAAGESHFHAADAVRLSDAKIGILNVEEGEIYDIELRYQSAADVLSAPLPIAGHLVTGATEPPDNVVNFRINMRGDSAHLSWDAVADMDLSHYHIRFSPLTSGVTWGSAFDLIERVAAPTTSATVPATTGTFLIRAVDAGGRYSPAAATVTSSVSSVAGLNLVNNFIQDPDFPGSFDDTGVADGLLVLAGSDTVDDWADFDIVFNTDVGNNGLVAEGTYTFSQVYDLGYVFTATLSAMIEAAGLDVNSDMDVWVDVDNVESWDGSIDPSKWAARLEIRTTQDNPAGSPTWSGWMPFVVGDYTARAFDFRLRLSTFESGITPAVSGLSAKIEMTDRIFTGQNLVAPVAGLPVTFDNAFYSTPSVVISPIDLASGDYFTLGSVTEEGFFVTFSDSADDSVERSFNYMAQGYGLRL